jgi:hypothetical protein
MSSGVRLCLPALSIDWLFFAQAGIAIIGAVQLDDDI